MKIEQLFREKKIVAMFCTSTLVEGVNLHAENLFITTYRKGLGQTKMTPVDFKNLVGRVGCIDYNLYGNVFLVCLEENLKVKDFVELLEKEIPELKPSLVTELKSKQKKKIIECLLQGHTNLVRGESQSQDSFDLTRKFCLMLLRDIMNGRNSIVRRAFSEDLTPDVEDKIRSAFETDEDENGWTIQGEPQDFLEKLYKVFGWGKCESN